MKTTNNNKLLDNTGNPVSHNRPTEKYSYRTFDGEHKTELIPISDAKYIEYLEEQVSDTFGKLVSVEELSKQTISTLEKENKELKNTYELILDSRDKEILELKAVNKELVNKFINQQDQFLKVVESVLSKPLKNSRGYLICEPIKIQFREYILQEIKSAIEKGKDDC